jgi:hypothetical protein
VVSRGRHPKKPSAKAIELIDGDRFDVIEIHRSHRWGFVRCLECGATEPIWSTPKVPENNARALIRFTLIHTHQGASDDIA